MLSDPKIRDSAARNLWSLTNSWNTKLGREKQDKAVQGSDTLGARCLGCSFNGFWFGYC